MCMGKLVNQCIKPLILAVMLENGLTLSENSDAPIWDFFKHPILLFFICKKMFANEE